MRNAVVIIVAAGFCVASAVATERELRAEESTVVGEQLTGTVLHLTPPRGFDRAVLRVVGPDGYALTKRVPAATSVTADLLADATLEFRLVENEAGAIPLTGDSLADGRYRYEVEFLTTGARSWHTGTFYVGGGVAISRQRMRERLTMTRGKLIEDSTRGVVGSTAGIGPEGYAGEDYILIADTANDGFTVLDMGSDFANGTKRLDWSLINKDGIFYIDDSLTGGPPSDTSSPEVTFDSGIRIGTVATLQGDTRLGIGTATPQAPLHIVDSLLPWIVIEDAEAGTDWQIRHSGSLRFVHQVNNVSTTRLSIDLDGNVGIGTAASAKLHVAGSGIIEGDVALGSSRTIKHAFEPIDSATVLAAVRDLPLYRWKYKDDPLQALHVGPMAEDVHAAFEIGSDDQHLSPADTAGLALAAVQGLQRALQRKDAQIADLTARLVALESGLAVDTR